MHLPPRGALFFGPGWRVTRNKLMFRDNLAQQLADAVPSTGPRARRRSCMLPSSRPRALIEAATQP